jgi:hypothetical protein
MEASMQEKWIKQLTHAKTLVGYIFRCRRRLASPAGRGSQKPLFVRQLAFRFAVNFSLTGFESALDKHREARRIRLLRSNNETLFQVTFLVINLAKRSLTS